MLNDFRSALARSQHTIVQDTVGALALAVILLVSLHLPGVL